MYYIQLKKIQFTKKRGSIQKFSVAWQPFLNYFENGNLDKNELLVCYMSVCMYVCRISFCFVKFRFCSFAPLSGCSDIGDVG